MLGLFNDFSSENKKKLQGDRVAQMAELVVVVVVELFINKNLKRNAFIMIFM